MPFGAPTQGNKAFTNEAGLGWRFSCFLLSPPKQGFCDLSSLLTVVLGKVEKTSPHVPTPCVTHHHLYEPIGGLQWIVTIAIAFVSSSWWDTGKTEVWTALHIQNLACRGQQRKKSRGTERQVFKKRSKKAWVDGWTLSLEPEVCGGINGIPMWDSWGNMMS